MEKRIGWIGLGLIGLPMAARLAAAGWGVRGFDINSERLSLAGQRGIAKASGLEDAIAGAQLVFTSLPTEKALVDLSGKLAAALQDVTIWVETSTVGPQASARAAQNLGNRGRYLRAPISGSTNL